MDKALGFIRRSVGENGAIGLGDPDLLEYPNYATAYAVRCLVLSGDEADHPLIQRMADYLIAAQYQAANGIPVSGLLAGKQEIRIRVLSVGEAGSGPESGIHCDGCGEMRLRVIPLP